MTGITSPAPTGGWNAVNSLAAMPPTDAIELVNLIPSAESVTTRRGFSGLPASVTANTSPVYTLAAYTGDDGTNKLISGCDGKLAVMSSPYTSYVEAGSLPPFANDKWQHSLHVSGDTTRMILTNGAETPMTYDGSSFAYLDLTGPTDNRGGEEVTVGDFASDSDWTKGNGWTISGGTASSDGTQSADSDLLSDTATLDSYRRYEVVFTVSNYSAGNVTAVAGTTEGTDRAANGTFTETITTADDATFAIRADADFVGDIDDVSVKQVLTGSDIKGSVPFKGRMLYWENDAPHFWYAAAGAYSGTVTKFSVNQFTQGGTVAAIYNWTRDGGAGMDDHLVILMKTGEVLIYSGSDPGSDVSLIGSYRIGRPIGDRPGTSVGGDLIIITEDGFVALSSAIQEGRYSENSLYSFKISSAAQKAARDHGNEYGWESQLYPNEALFLVNVPISNTESEQYVRNTTTGSWCRFSGINAVSMATMNGLLYFGGINGEILVYGGTSDDGEFINYRSTQAYQSFGNPHKNKQITAVEPVTNYRYPKYIYHDFWGDFNNKDLQAIVDPPEPVPSQWDVGEWDTATWDAPDTGTTPTRKNAHGYGRFIAHTTRFRSRAQQVRWFSTNYVLKAGGYV